jgi:hypothetical protein
MPTKTIEIDFDIHRLIESERRGFEEPENAALRRLLKLPEPPSQSAPATRIEQSAVTEVEPWSWKGVQLPHGTDLRMEYAGQIVHGRVEQGRWVVEGKHYKSPSDAAGSSVKTKDGSTTNLNGWMYWEIKRPGESNWRRLQSMKPRA